MTMLYEATMEKFVLMEKTRVSDGLGGWISTWAEGEQFMASISKDNSTQGRSAEKAGLTEIYTVTVKKNNPLEFHDVIKRLSDGMIFRITSNIKDNTSPEFSLINFGQVSAEAWVLE